MQTGSTAGALILCFVVLRVFAGVAENAGVPRLSEAAGMALCAALVLQFVRDWRLARGTIMLFSGFMLWILASGLSAAFAPLAEPIRAWSLSALLLLYALFANALWANLHGPTGLRLVHNFLMFFLVLGSLIALTQFVAGTGFVDQGKPDVMRVFGTDVHPVSFGLQIVLALVGVQISRLKLGLRFSIWNVLIVAVALSALYLTFARTAWGVLAVVGICLAAGTGSIHRRVLATVALACVLTAAVSLSPRFDDLASLPEFLSSFDFNAPVFDHRTVSNSFSWRIVNWAFGLQYASDALLSGYGPGQSADASLFGLEMHNILLEALFELGVPGLIAVVVVILGFLRLHMSLPRATPGDRLSRLMANGVGLGLLAATLFSTSLVDQLMTVLVYMMMLRAASIPACTSSLPRPVARDNLGCHPASAAKGNHELEASAGYRSGSETEAALAAGSGPSKSGHGTGYGLGHVRDRQSIGHRAARGDTAGAAHGQEGLSGGMAVPGDILH